MKRYKPYKFDEMSKASSGYYIYKGFISVLENKKIILKPVEADIFKDTNNTWRLNIHDNRYTYESGDNAQYKNKNIVINLLKQIFNKNNDHIYYPGKNGGWFRAVKGYYGYDEIAKYL